MTLTNKPYRKDNFAPNDQFFVVKVNYYNPHSGHKTCTESFFFFFFNTLNSIFLYIDKPLFIFVF